MFGFPTRLIRSIFGPKLRDEHPVENPETQIPARAFNALFHQVAGMNLAMAVRATLIAAWDMDHFEIAYQEEAWNSNRDQARPELTRVTTGRYSYKFASTYKDEDGNDVPTDLVQPRVSTYKYMTSWNDRLFAYAWKDPADPLRVQVAIYDKDGTLVDEPFWLEVC
jgi:hypothetical protein